MILLYLAGGLVVLLAAFPIALMLLYVPMCLAFHPDIGLFGAWYADKRDTASIIRWINHEYQAKQYGS